MTNMRSRDTGLSIKPYNSLLDKVNVPYFVISDRVNCFVSPVVVAAITGDMCELMLVMAV